MRQVGQSRITKTVSMGQVLLHKNGEKRKLALLNLKRYEVLKYVHVQLRFGMPEYVVREQMNSQVKGKYVPILAPLPQKAIA